MNDAFLDTQVLLTDRKTLKFGDVGRRIKKARREFEWEHANFMYRVVSPRERELPRQLNIFLHKEEVMAR